MIRRVRKVPVSVGAVGLGSEAFLGLFFFSLFIGLKGFVFFCFVIFVFLGVGFSIIFHYFFLFFPFHLPCRALTVCRDVHGALCLPAATCRTRLVFFPPSVSISVCIRL